MDFPESVKETVGDGNGRTYLENTYDERGVCCVRQMKTDAK